MSGKILKIRYYNEDTTEFEEGSIKTAAEAVEMPDGTTLPQKTDEIELKIQEVEQKVNDIECSGGVGSITVSETPPENPVNGQIWFETVGD